MGIVLFCTAWAAAQPLITEAVPGQHFNLGMTAYRHRQYPVAVPYFQSALRYDPTNANIYYYLADTYLKLRRFNEAQLAYQRVIALSPYSQAAKLAETALGQFTTLSSSATHPITASGSSAQGNPDDKLALPFGDDNYLADMTEKGRYLRWSVLKLPIKLYIEDRPSGISNFQPQFVASVRRAFDVWAKALDNQISCKVVDQSTDADIKVTWVNRLNSRGQKTEEGVAYQAGITTPVYEGLLLQQMTIELATLDLSGKPQSPGIMNSVAIHEMGHALGLIGHSKNPDDVMSAATQEPHTALSTRDVNTIRALYSRVVDMTNRPLDAEPTDEQQTEISQRMQTEIEQLEQKVQRSGDNLDWLNLGNLYFDKAEFLRQEDKGDEAKALYDKALNGVSQALKKEPTYGPAYSMRALILERQGQYEQAYADSEKALKYAPREALHWEQNAILLNKLGRKTEAKNRLDQLIQQFPESKNKSSVQRLKQQLG